MDDDEDPSIQVLVAAAAAGDAGAWHELVDRYSPLLVNVIRRYRLSAGETEDVAQTVWLRLVEHLDSLREPRALPMWLVTTGRREALRHVTVQRRTVPHDPSEPALSAREAEQADLDEVVMREERHRALLAGLAELPPRQRQLLVLLTEDPPLSYQQIHQRTGIPIGSIGPTRARALERLRQTQPIRAHFDHDPVPTQAGADRRDDATLG